MPKMHVCGWWESVDGAAVFNTLNALADPLGLADGVELIVPDLTRVIAVAGLVASGSTQRARLDSPSLRKLGRYELNDLNGGADADAVWATPQIIMDLRFNPLTLVPTERVTAEIDSDTTAAEPQAVLLILSDGPVEELKGRNMFSVRVTGAVTLVAGAWTNGVMTFADALPVGRYAIVGSRWEGVSLLAARYVFQDSPWKPGVFAVQDENNTQDRMFRYGGLGSMGEFESTRPPTVDFLGNVADTAQTGILDLIQIREGPA